ncbi:MAG: ABC transporter substrate-binding protein [Myxococcota bacterium]|jgi:ABC-type branched-subunit amino acid transport system substrate-binding protein|nr:ABC transporter substrate-binding protein [Myxococcota bacterium]
MTHPPRHLLPLGVLAATLLGLPAGAYGPYPEPPPPPPATAPATTPTAPATPTAADGTPIYANTPQELAPFSRFVKEPYRRFFVEKLDYYGPGRDLPEPEVDTVVIGLLTPLERSQEAYIGQAILAGATLAIDDANARGGYRGKPFALDVRNDTGMWGASANEIIRFAHDSGARVILGTVDGANTHIAIRVALKVEIPMITVGDLDPTLPETKIPWIFRVVPDDRQQAYTLAYYLYRQLDRQRVAVIRANNRYGRFGVREFLDSSVRLGRPAPLEVNYEIDWARTNPDFTLQIERMRLIDPDAIVLWADAAPAGTLVRKLREAGIAAPVFACDRVIHPEFFAAAGVHAEGVVAVAPYDPEAGGERFADFHRRYSARFGQPPCGYAAHAYDGTMLAVQAIQQAGLNWAKIRDALAGLQLAGVTGPISFQHDLANRRRVLLSTARGGEFVIGEPRAETRF